MTVVLLIFWAIISYLACRVAYVQGRRDKWEDVSRNYICLHKTCCVVPVVYERNKKHLTKGHKKAKLNHPIKPK